MNLNRLNQLIATVRNELKERLQLYSGQEWSESMREEIRCLAKEVVKKQLPARACKNITAMVNLASDGYIDIRLMDHKGRIS